MRRLLLIPCLLAIAAIAAACGAGNATPTQGPAATSTPAGGQTPMSGATPTPTLTPTPTSSGGPSGDTLALDIRNFVLPTVTVQVGTTVVWTNQDAAPHTATGGRPGAQEGFDSGTLQRGQSYEFTFDQPGEFPYFCIVHPSMTGVITVDDGSGGAAETSAGVPTPTPTRAPLSPDYYDDYDGEYY